MSVKVGIIGAGLVGATCAFTLMMGGLPVEITLVDRDPGRAEGEAMDLNHCATFIPPVKVAAGSYEDCRGAELIIIAAGSAQRPGESRLDLLARNSGIIREIVQGLSRHCPDAVYLVVSNPVDVLTCIVSQTEGVASRRVIGSGTVLDSSRFRHLLAEYCSVDPRHIHAYVIGEHGDSEVPVWSTASVAGLPFEQFCEQRRRPCSLAWKEGINLALRSAAYQIIERKGATYYAVALAVRRIAESIVRNEHAVLTVSSMISGPYGLDDVCLSLPTIVTREGVGEILKTPLAADELDALRQSAEAVRRACREVGI